MSSFLCFLCHSTVNSETTEEIREKYRDIVGMNLCPDSQLCYICCQMLNKLYLFKSVCLKRSLEYPVLFSERGAINLQRTDIEMCYICPEDTCKDTLYRNIHNTKQYTFKYQDSATNKENYNYYDESNEYVNFEEDRNIENESRIDNRNTNHEYTTDCANNVYSDMSNFNDNENTINNFYNNDHYIQNNVNENQPLCDTHIESNCVKDDEVMDANSNDGNSYCSTESICNDIDDGETIIDELETNEEDIDRNTEEFDRNIDKIDELEKNSTTNIEIDKTKEEIETTNGEQETKDELDQETLNKETKKSKKKKKDGYKKIVLSFKEQKAVLDAQRKSKKYLEAEFKCHSCALGFLFKDTYQSHMVRHEESNGQFSCNVCGLRFATQNARCMHTILHSELHRCHRCGVEVKRTHRKRHSAACWQREQCVACRTCGQSFRDADCLQQHIKRAHAAKSNKRVYTCNVCGKAYNEQGAVRTHMVKHINKRFTCDQCPSTFTSPYTLNQHKKIHSVEIVKQQYYCKTCDRWHRNKRSFIAHFKNSLKHQANSYECPICSRNCPTPKALSSHIATHSNTKPHYCHICGATRVSKHSLTRHMRRHTGQQDTVLPAVCHVCGRCFKGNSKLNRHLREVCERARLEEQLAALYEQSETM